MFFFLILAQYYFGKNKLKNQCGTFSGNSFFEIEKSKVPSLKDKINSIKVDQIYNAITILTCTKISEDYKNHCLTQNNLWKMK